MIRPLAALAVVTCLLAPAAVRAQVESEDAAAHPTNMAMLTDAAQAAVSEMLMTLSIAEGSTVLLESESAHEARWFVENLILDQLTSRGFVVTLKPDEVEEAASEPAAADSAAADTAAADTAATPGMFTDTMEWEEPEVDYVLRFRVAECGLTYPRAFRKSPFGTKLVQRFAVVSIFGTLVKGDRESVVWVGRGDSERLDHVPSGKLALLEGQTFPFTHPEIESRGITAYAEPALVVGIVLGLVYLFYTNQ